MCGGHEHGQSSHAIPQKSAEQSRSVPEGDESSRDNPPDWENMSLPPDYILAHLTDAHCHPTDLDQTPETYDEVKLGGIAAMGTIPEDQPKVARLGSERGWKAGSIDRNGAKSARVVSCFGYHPWFAHRYTLHPGISRSEHYFSIFFPPSDPSKPDNSRRRREKEALEALLPFYPDPVPFEPLVQGIKDDLEQVRADRRLGMVGEVGLDGGARVLWPKEARHLYDEDKRALRADWREVAKTKEERLRQESSKAEESDAGYGQGEENAEDAWKRLAPFKISMAHQQAILKAQLEVAVELGVPVSLHCVAAPGPTMDVLKEMRDTHGPRFTNRVNVDLHSGGGWSPEYWSQAAKQLSNLYASPSIYITGRNSNPAGLIRAISPDRMLVESDTHDVTRCTRLVWGATEWIARVKEWELESDTTENWSAESLVQSEEEWVRRNSRRAKRDGAVDGQDGRAQEGNVEKAMESNEEAEKAWAVKTLERNWARFMGLIEPYE